MGEEAGSAALRETVGTRSPDRALPGENKERTLNMRLRTNSRSADVACVAMLLLLGLLLAPGTARAQGDGPHNLPLIPINTNIFTPQVLVLSGNFIPAMTAVVPGATVDVVAVPITYIRTFALGSHFGRLFVVLPVSTLDATADVFDPIRGQDRSVDKGRSGIMDPMVTLHIGLAGAPALKPMEFMKHPKSFQMVAIAGVGMPFGTYDSSRLINLGTNRWTIRTGIGTVFPFGEQKRTALEMSNNLYFFTKNSDVRGADYRQQDPLYVMENHLTHNFTKKAWGSVDARYQYGGAVATDGVSDHSWTNALGGGGTFGYQFTLHFGAWTSLDKVLLKSGDAKETMFRFQIAYSF